MVSFGVFFVTVSRRNENASPKIVSVQRDLARHSHRRGRVVVLALLVLELHVQALALHLLDAAELVDEVHVPGLAAELAVGGRLQAHVLLHGHDLADGLVLGRLERVVVDRARGVVVACLEQRLRPQQAAYVVRPERRLVPMRHRLPRFRVPGLVPRLSTIYTGGVPYVWKLSTVFTRQAWPSRRSSSLHTTGGCWGS